MIGYTSCSAQSAAVTVTSLEASFGCIGLSLALCTFGDFCRPEVRQSGNLAVDYAADWIVCKDIRLNEGKLGAIAVQCPSTSGM